MKLIGLKELLGYVFGHEMHKKHNFMAPTTKRSRDEAEG